MRLTPTHAVHSRFRFFAARSRGWLAGLAAATLLWGCGGGGSSGDAGAEKASPASGIALPSDTVTTRFGTVQGNTHPGVYEFLGIPFAKAPKESLRWKKPVDPTVWSGVRAAKAFGPACPQKNFPPDGGDPEIVGDEDCLQLNVWTPSSRMSELPVLVFIHGGGQQQGSASDIASGTQIYNGRNMALRGKAVVVTIQYRLGPLGFLAYPGLEPENGKGTSGNYGVLDQIHALTWVKNNIGAFGGDPSRVMVFGESAGAVNVGNLLTSPLAAGLFQRAAIQSGGPLISKYTRATEKGIDFVNELGVTGATPEEKIAKLRTPVWDWRTLIASADPPVVGGRVQLYWQPTIDNLVFKSDAPTAFQSGSYNKVPVLIGSNADEMSLSVPDNITEDDVRDLINRSVPQLHLRPEARRLYPPSGEKTSYVQILTDLQFTATVRRTARAIAPQQSEPVWRYFFTHRHFGRLSTVGSYHGMELFYVFNNWENTPYARLGGFQEETDGVVQAEMLKSWVAFASTGNPNGPGSASWPRFVNGTDCYLEIKAPPNGTQCGVRTEKSDFWDLVASQ